MSLFNPIRPGFSGSPSSPNIYLLRYLRYLYLYLLIRFQFRGYEQMSVLIVCACMYVLMDQNMIVFLWR